MVNSITLKLDHIPSTLNEYVNAQRANKWGGNKLKQDNDNLIRWAIRKQNIKPIATPCKLSYLFTLSHAKYDLDNLAFCAKFVHDALVKEGIIPNDNVNHIQELNFSYAKGQKEGVNIQIFQV